MRACLQCGASNGPADHFCGTCGAYMNWSDTDRAPSTPREPPAAPASTTPPDRPPASGPAPPEGPPPEEPAPQGVAPDATAASAPSPAARPATPGPDRASPRTRPTGRSRLTGRGRGRGEAGAAGPVRPAGSRTGGEEGAGAVPGREEAAGPPPPAGPGGPRTGPAAPAHRASTGDGGGTPRTGGAPPTAVPDPSRSEPAAPRTGARPPRTPATPGAAPPDPVPVRPAKPVAPRPVVRPAAEPDEGTGTPCPACGTPNPPARRFCRRCAAELNPAAKPAPLPWWRTVWPFRRRARAGSGRAVRFLVVLAVVVALCAGGLLLLPAGRALFEDARDKLRKPKPVVPVAVEASTQVPRHPATNSTDGLSNRYWGAAAPGASVTYTFGRPFRLVDLLITNGASASRRDYARQARALRMDMEVTTQGGERHRREIVLGDRPGPQAVPTGISGVKTVRLVLRSAVGLAPGRHLALAEVEFFRRG